MWETDILLDSIERRSNRQRPIPCWWWYKATDINRFLASFITFSDNFYDFKINICLNSSEQKKIHCRWALNYSKLQSMTFKKFCINIFFGWVPMSPGDNTPQSTNYTATITKTIQVRPTRHAGHCWKSRDELISDVLLWTPTYGRAKAGRPEDLPEVINDREKWRERVRDIRAGGTTWWWYMGRFFIKSKGEFF